MRKTFFLFIVLLVGIISITSCRKKEDKPVDTQNKSDEKEEQQKVSETYTSLQEIKIGTQTWATKNLDVSTFRNGDAIAEANTDAAWEKAGNEQKPAWCYYDNDPANGKTYGKLYNWYAVNDQRGSAPKGWHIPSNKDWTVLINYLGKDEAGTKMKSSSGWESNGNGTNTSGFTGLPGGYRNDIGSFSMIDIYGGAGGVLQRVLLASQGGYS